MADYDFREAPEMENIRFDPESRVCVVSLPLPEGAPAYDTLDSLRGQGQPVGWWPASRVGQPGVVRRQLLFGLADGPLPRQVKPAVSGPAAPAPWAGPEIACRVVSKKNSGIILNEVNELTFRAGERAFGLRLGLRHEGQYRWWEWVRLEELWSGPVCRAFRAGGFIPVKVFDDSFAGAFEHGKKSTAVHLHNWLRGEVYVQVFANGVIRFTCRHVNNHMFDHGRDLEDVRPVLAFNSPGASGLPGKLDGSATRFDLAGAALNLDEAAGLFGPEHPGRLAEEDGLVIYQPYDGVEISGDNHHRVRDDGFIVRAEEGLFPKGVARTVRFTMSLGEAAPLVSRLTVPAWWYALARELWGDDALPVQDEHGRLPAAAEAGVLKEAAGRPRSFDAATLTREVWEGEIPYSQMLYYYLSGDPAFFDIALDDSYHVADISFDHATETMRMHNFPFGPIALPLFRTVAMTYAWLETGDPYLLECSESAATRYYWLDRHNWPRRSYGRDAASLRSLVFLWDYTGKEDYRTMAREALGRALACQRPDGSWADQGGAVNACGGACNEITKPWMAMLASDPAIDYLLRCPGDRELEASLVRTAGFILGAQLEDGGRFYWTYQYAHGDNPGDPREMLSDPEGYTRFPSPRQPRGESGYKARFLPFVTLLTADHRYLEAWQRHYRTVLAAPGYTPRKVGYTSNKMIQNIPFLQAHLWNARAEAGGVRLAPLATGEAPVMSGTVLTPFGPLEVKCRREKEQLALETRAPRDFRVTLLWPDGTTAGTMGSNDRQTFAAG